MTDLGTFDEKIFSRIGPKIVKFREFAKITSLKVIHAKFYSKYLLEELVLNSPLVLRENIFVFVEEKVNKTFLLGFADSSNQVYCGVDYLRIETSIGVRVKFVASKTKVAPIKALSIPRLELLGCVLLSKLLSEIVVAISNWTRRTFYNLPWNKTMIEIKL